MGNGNSSIFPPFVIRPSGVTAWWPNCMVPVPFVTTARKHSLKKAPEYPGPFSIGGYYDTTGNRICASMHQRGYTQILHLGTMETSPERSIENGSWRMSTMQSKEDIHKSNNRTPCELCEKASRDGSGNMV